MAEFGKRCRTAVFLRETELKQREIFDNYV